MKTDNELIADFMGIEVSPYTHYAYGDVIAIVPKEGIIDYPQLNIYNPDTSWDWLMPVVEKIGTLDKNERVSHMYSTEINPNGTTITPSMYTSETKWMIRHNSRNMLINTYKAVVEFIKWYNKQK